MYIHVQCQGYKDRVANRLHGRRLAIYWSIYWTMIGRTQTTKDNLHVHVRLNFIWSHKHCNILSKLKNNHLHQFTQFKPETTQSEVS